MQETTLQAKVLAAARAQTPSEAVPYGFERRVMAHIQAGAKRADPWRMWAQALWRAAAPCAGVALLLGAWTLLDVDIGAANGTDEFAQHFENTVLAGAVVEQSLE